MRYNVTMKDADAKAICAALAVPSELLKAEANSASQRTPERSWWSYTDREGREVVAELDRFARPRYWKEFAGWTLHDDAKQITKTEYLARVATDATTKNESHT